MKNYQPTIKQPIARAILFTLTLAQILAFTAFMVRDTRSYKLEMLNYQDPDYTMSPEQYQGYIDACN
jgi:hypothetical protein